MNPVFVGNPYERPSERAVFSPMMTIETQDIMQDIRLGCIVATSFPMAVHDAHLQIRELLPPATGRNYFGISHPVQGRIVYWAGATIINENETLEPPLELCIVRKGTYYCIPINDYMSRLSAIGQAFERLIHLPDIDRNGACTEWYLNDKDVLCLVRKAE